MRDQQNSIKSGAKMGPRAHWGQKGPPVRQKAPGGHFNKPIWEVILEARAMFFDIIFDMCLKPSFSLLGRLLAKVPKRLPKRNKHEAKSMLGGTLWEVLKPRYLLYWRVMGRSWGGSRGQLFPDCVSRLSLEASWEAFLQILGDLGCPLGLLGASF